MSVIDLSASVIQTITNFENITFEYFIENHAILSHCVFML